MKALREFIIRLFVREKPKGVMTALPNKELVDMNVAVIAEKLMRNGIDPRSLKNANQVENAIKMIDDRPAVQEGITSTESAKVFNIKGDELDPNKPIIGGTQPGKKIDTDTFIRLAERNPQLIKQKIADKKVETDAEIKARLDKGNREGISRIRERQKMIDEAIDNVSPGFSGDLRVDADLVAEEMATRMGKVYDDLPDLEGTRLYGEAYDALSKKRFESKIDPEDFAQGGRAGFANGTGAPSIKYDFDREQGPMGPVFETNKVEDAIREIIKRKIPTDFANIPITDRTGIMLGFDDVGIAGETDLLGGELRFGAGKNFGTDEKKFGLEFRKELGGRKGKRVNRKDGSGMTRRTFLKILGGAMAIPIIGKFLKPLKTAKGVTKVPMIKTDDVPGKPEWFDQLVNKVIVEGDDVTKKFATGERQSIHQKTLDDGSVVRVTEDIDDGAVRVEYESEANVYGDPVQMQYKKPLPDEGDPRPKAEFTTAESGPVGRADGPDDYSIEIDEVGGSSIKDLDSDVSKLKEYATGKGPTMKEIVQNKKRKDKAARITEGGEGEMDAVIRRQGEFIENDLVDLDPPDLASGGIARMLGE